MLNQPVTSFQPEPLLSLLVSSGVSETRHQTQRLQRLGVHTQLRWCGNKSSPHRLSPQLLTGRAFIESCAAADEKGKFDELVEQNGVQVLIDSPALMHLFGTRIDFVEDRIRYTETTCRCSLGHWLELL